MDKTQVTISQEEYREYQCLKKGIPYIPSKEYKAKFISIDEIVESTKQFLERKRKENKYKL